MEKMNEISVTNSSTTVSCGTQPDEKNLISSKNLPYTTTERRDRHDVITKQHSLTADEGANIVSEQLVCWNFKKTGLNESYYFPHDITEKIVNKYNEIRKMTLDLLKRPEYGVDGVPFLLDDKDANPVPYQYKNGILTYSFPKNELRQLSIWKICEDSVMETVKSHFSKMDGYESIIKYLSPRHPYGIPKFNFGMDNYQEESARNSAILEIAKEQGWSY